jgi:PadR family transcriptional regulator, regulatory protein PadR
MPASTQPLDLLQGTLDVLVLKTLSWGPRHGYAIARWIERVTDDALRIEEGSLYPALYRLEKRGWVTSDWGLTDTKRRAKFYRLSPQGRAQLRAQLTTWAAFSEAVGKVLRAAEDTA